MKTGFFTPPDRVRFALRNVRVPVCLLPPAFASDEELAAVDLLVDDGSVAAVERGGTLPAELGPDLDRSMVLPGLLDVHTHLDKGHTWPRMQNPTGDFAGAAQATGIDRSTRWTADDVRRRMEFGLEAAYAHGVVAIRTHLDAIAPQTTISFGVFREMRERWAGRIDLQASSIGALDYFLTDDGRELADIVAESGGYLGCVSRLYSQGEATSGPDFDRAVTTMFALATERGLNLDLHVDENGDPESRSLLRIAELATKLSFKGDILCGHCCSLAVQDDDRIEATLDACFEAGLAVTTLPAANMYLQARAAGRTPRWRGVTVLHEMKARGLRVVVAGDNCRDAFYAYGDHDMLDTFVQAVKVMHLDHPLDDWIASVTTTPAGIMGLPERGRIGPGLPADLIVLKARTYSEMLSRNQADRVVLRSGRAIDTTPPDYRVLDDLMAP